MNNSEQIVWTPEPDRWERFKAALRRDWYQTRSDFGVASGQDLNQGIVDTLAQASGRSPIPPLHVANPVDVWSDEVAMRYGYSSVLSPNYHGHQGWSDALEAQLKSGWEAMTSQRRWDEVRSAVRYGWTRSQGERRMPSVAVTD